MLRQAAPTSSIPAPKNAQIAQLGIYSPLAVQRKGSWSKWIVQCVPGLLVASRPKMSVLIRCQNRMRETVQARRRGVDGKLLRHIERICARISTFSRRFVPKCGRRSHLASPVVHPERAECLLSVEYTRGDCRADRRPNGTYIERVNKRNK